MKSKKFSMKNIDDETAELLDKEYPTELTSDDIDDIFKKSYEKFLQADISGGTETEDNSEVISESDTFKVVHTKHRYTFFTLIKACAILCGITAVYAMLGMPEHEIETPEDNESPPDVTYNTSAVTSISTEIKTTAYSDKTTVTATNETSVPSSSEVSDSSEITTAVSDTGYTEKTTEIQNEETELQTETVSITDTKANIASSIETVMTATQAETASSPPTTATQAVHYGDFKYITYETENKWNELKYERDPDIPIEKFDYTFEFEGYEMSVYRDDLFSKNLNLTEISTGDHFDLKIVPYEYFGNSLNTKYEWIIEMTEINGKPAVVSRRSDDENGICTLHWDNGGSICSITGFFAHLDKMRYIAENLR